MLRPATPADAEQIVATLREAFEGYRSFAPAGWEPPDAAGELDRVPSVLGDPGRWCAVAEVDGELAGHAAFVAAERGTPPVTEAGLAHLSELFVRPPFWGSGVASRLLAAAVGEAAARGYRSMRLCTPSGQSRARRFYEREGWSLTGAAFEHGPLGLAVVEYRRVLPGAPAPEAARQGADPGGRRRPPAAPAR